MKLNISPKGEKSQSFICYKKGKRHLSLVHSEDEESLRKDYAVVIPISKFLSLIIGNAYVGRNSVSCIGQNQSLTSSLT
jgi:hypothetical protein